MKLESDNKVFLLFVGTGSAKVNSNRFHTSFIISNSTSNILIDCGDGISKKLNEINYDLGNIHNILITHLHPDHFSGLASLVVQMKLHKRTRPLNIFIHKKSVQFLEYFFEQVYLIKERLPFLLSILPFDFETENIISDNFIFIARQNSHLEKYSADKTRNSINYASPSFLFTIDGAKIYFSSDIGGKKDLYLFSLPVDISIVETTHIEIDSITEFVKSGFAKKYFTVHIDEEKEKLIYNVFSEDIEKGRVFIPNDGDEYFI